MVTLITEQLRKQSLEEPYYKAFSFNVNVVSRIQTKSCPFLNGSLFLDSLRFMGSGFEFKLMAKYFCFSHYRQWAPVPLSRGVLVDRHKASSLN